MAKIVIFAVFIVLNTFLPVSLAGTVALQHRNTNLEDLKSIDSFVSSALPSLGVLQNGFFVGTSRGPVLVKSEPPPGTNTRPTVSSKYYNTLPRLIPAGFEGIAVSHFNLGAANPYQPLSPSKSLVTIPVASEPQHFVTSQVAQPAGQYVTQPVVAQTQPIYHQAQQYVAEAQQPQEYVAQPQEQYIQNEQPQQQFIQEDQPQQQYIQNEQPQQQFIQDDQPQQQYIQNEQPQQQFLQNEQPQQQFLQNEQPQQQFLQNEQPQQQQQQQQFIQNEQPQQYLQSEQSQQYLQAEQPQQNFFQEEQPQHQQQFIQSGLEQPQQQFLQPEQSQQQQFQFPQQYNGAPSQFISEQPADSQQAAQESAQISASSHTPTSVAEPSFQVDNLLRPEQDQGGVTTFQTQVFGAERFQSQKLLRSPAVVATTEFEETLPETLRNRFYKNANLATILAQESLPIQGEQIISEWDTNKIAKGKIHALLRGAGLI